jgi:hypothetical protein
MVAGCSMLSIVGLAWAGKLEDFRDTSNAAGCNSIPYSDLRNTCRSQQEVHPWCDGARGPTSCKSGVSATMRENLTAEYKHLAGFEEAKRSLESKRSHASDDAERARANAELARCRPSTSASTTVAR